MFRRLSALCLSVALCTVTMATSHADKKGAERLFRIGQHAYEAGSFREASEALEAAYAQWPAPDIAFSAAQAYRLHYFETRVSRSLFRAAELYRIYLEAVPSGGRRADAALNLAELEPILRTMQPEVNTKEPPRTRIAVSSTVAEAEVSLEGDEFAPAPRFADVEPGRLRYRVRAPRHHPKEGTLQVFAGQFATAEVTLDPIPAEVIVDVEDAEVYVEGLRAKNPRLLQLEPGKHRIDIRKRGHQLVTLERTFEGATHTVLKPKLERSGRRKIAVGLLGASAITGSAALATGLWALKNHFDIGDLEDKRTDVGLTVTERREYNSLIDRRDRRRFATYALTSVTAALAIAGGLVYYFDTPTVLSPVTPVVSPSGVGVQGQF